MIRYRYIPCNEYFKDGAGVFCPLCNGNNIVIHVAHGIDRPVMYCLRCYEFLSETDDSSVCPLCHSDIFVVDWYKFDVEDWLENHVVREEWK